MYPKILVPIDTSYNDDYWLKSPLERACGLLEKPGGTLYAMTVVPENLLRGYYPDLYSEDIASSAKDKLDAIVKRNCPSDVTVKTRVANGGICTEILRVASEISVDLIIMASHGPLTRDYLLGSNAGHITLHAPCSVFVVRENHEPKP